MFKLVTCVMLVVALYGVTNGLFIGHSVVCGPNEVYSKCANKQTPYCNQEPKEATEIKCFPGCVCKPGYIRRALDSDECVPKTHCFSIRCEKNEIYRTCQKCLSLTCEQQLAKISRTCDQRRCISGCVCKDNFYINDYRGRHCVAEEECLKLN